MDKLFRFKYTCTCGELRNITRVYFCRHCLKLRCCECVSHEVDSHYCQNCMEYMPSTEARLKRNKCSNCFVCPCCRHTLSTRATSVQVPSSDDPEKTVPKKVYYLVCGFCRWTSRDVAIPDQITATGGWQEKENEHMKRISALMEHYRMLAQKEKIEKEKKKHGQRCSYFHFPDKFGMTSMIAKKFAHMKTAPSSFKNENQADALFIPEATSDVETLPERYLTEPINLSTICTIQQRLAQPQFQPAVTSELYPQQKYLHIKRSQRCKECEHNVSKPEYNPSSIKFKIQLTAFSLIPEVYSKTLPPLYVNKECVIELIICNPTPHPTHASLLPAEDKEKCFAKVILPAEVFLLAARDDTAEFDDSIEVQQFKDDPKIVSFRKSNKIGLYVTVIPQKPGDVVISFTLKHDFTDTYVQLQAERREPQVVWLTHTITANLAQTVEEQNDL